MLSPSSCCLDLEEPHAAHMVLVVCKQHTQGWLSVPELSAQPGPEVSRCKACMLACVLVVDTSRKEAAATAHMQYPFRNACCQATHQSKAPCAALPSAACTVRPAAAVPWWPGQPAGAQKGAGGWRGTPRGGPRTQTCGGGSLLHTWLQETPPGTPLGPARMRHKWVQQHVRQSQQAGPAGQDAPNAQARFAQAMLQWQLLERNIRVGQCLL